MATEIVIHDGNYQDFIDPTVNGEVKACASLERREKFGALPFASPTAATRMSESEIKEKARYLKENKSRISDLIRGMGVKPLDQNGTNFCWANGPVNTVRITRLVNNQPYEDLSPASVACPINGFRNDGGWGTEAMKFITGSGVVPTRLWPNNAIDRKYFTSEAKAEALKYKVIEWDDLPPRDFLMMCTYLVNGIPVTIGLNWWRHQVTAVDVEPDDLSVRVYNSWGDWSDEGFGLLTRSKATPDDACAARTIVMAV